MRTKKEITQQNYETFTEKAGMSFEECYESYHDRLQRWLSNYVGDSDLASDMTSEAFVKALENIDKYSPDYQFSTWLYTISKNIAKDHFAQQKKYRHSSIDQPIGSDDDGNMTLADMLMQEIDDKVIEDEIWCEKAEVIKDLIEDMDDKYREILTMRELQHMSYEDIHMSLNLNHNTAKSRIRQGRRKLREMAETRLRQIELSDRRTDMNYTM